MDDPGAIAQEARIQGRAFGALRHRDFRLFWGGAAISHVGTWMQQVAQGWLIYQLTGSALAVGLSGLFLSVPFVTMSLYAGTVVDRVDRKRVLVYVEALNLAIVLAVAILVVGGWVQVWHIYASNVLHALVGAFESPARSSLLPHLVPRADLMTAVSLHTVLRRGTQIVGPALGGVAVATVDVGGTYLLNASGYVVLLACLLAMRASQVLPEGAHSSPIRAAAEGLDYVRHHWVIGPLLLLELVMSLFGSYNPMLVVFAREVFHAGPEGFGLLQSASGVGTVIGSLVLTAVGNVQHKGRLMLASNALLGASVLAFAFCPWFLVALAFLAIAGAADIAMGSTRMTVIQLLAPGRMRGRVMSLHSITTRGTGPLGGFQTGTLATFLGVQAAVGVGALVCILATLAVAVRVPAIRRFVGTVMDAEPSAVLSGEGREDGRAALAPSPPRGGRGWG